MTFRQAVETTPGLGSSFCQGLQALRARDKKRITCRDRAGLAGSVNVDSALAAARPNERRWDYAIGMTVGSKPDRVLWIEVHPASSSDVKEVLDKFAWLTDWLCGSARKLGRLERRVVWVATGPVAILKGSRQAKLLAAQGLRFPRSHVVLDDVWKG